jgi:hypothetical protein
MISSEKNMTLPVCVWSPNEVKGKQLRQAGCGVLIRTRSLHGTARSVTLVTVQCFGHTWFPFQSRNTLQEIEIWIRNEVTSSRRKSSNTLMGEIFDKLKQTFLISL